jgi:hypothetical protein
METLPYIQGRKTEPKEVVDFENLHGAERGGWLDLKDLTDDPSIENKGHEPCKMRGGSRESVSC